MFCESDGTWTAFWRVNKHFPGLWRWRECSRKTVKDRFERLFERLWFNIAGNKYQLSLRRGGWGWLIENMMEEEAGEWRKALNVLQRSLDITPTREGAGTLPQVLPNQPNCPQNSCDSYESSSCPVSKYYKNIPTGLSISSVLFTL